MARPELSIVVPAYNEADCIATTVAIIRQHVQRLVHEWEIVVVDDGSEDDTASIARQSASGDPRVRVIQAEHAGKGAAVRRGMLEARGAWRLLTDADLSTPLEELPRVLAARSTHVDIVIGTREGAGARRIGEPWYRHAIGRVFNWIVKLTLIRGIEDTQCGFKLFGAAAADVLFRQQRIEGFGFDAEILFLAQRRGLRIVQMPVTWKYYPDSTVTPLSGSAGFVDLFRVRLNAMRGLYRLERPE